jgi:hypothetical protein
VACNQRAAKFTASVAVSEITYDVRDKKADFTGGATIANEQSKTSTVTEAKAMGLGDARVEENRSEPELADSPIKVKVKFFSQMWNAFVLCVWCR